MTPGDQIRYALKRSRVLLIVCTLVGIAAMVGIAQLQGPQFEASSSVLVQNDLQSANPNNNAAPTDVSTAAANAATLAGSSAFFDYLAQAMREQDPVALSHAITAQQSGTSNVVQFTTTAKTAARARQLADAVATAFPAYSGNVSIAPLQAAIRALAVQQATNPKAKSTIQRLQVLEGLSGNVTTLAQARSASRTRPRPAREGVEGLIVGLIVGLLIMAVREGLDQRARMARELEHELNLPIWGTLPRPRGDGFPRSIGTEAEKLAGMIERHRRPAGGTVIAIVGARANEGRTWVTATLASALEERGDRVCAVDDGSGVLISLLRPEGAGVNGAPSLPATTNGHADDGDGDDAGLREPVNGDGGDAGRSDAPLRRLVVLPAWATSRGVDQLRARFDWILVDAAWPFRAASADRAVPEADVVVLAVTPETARRESAASAEWSRDADAAILTTTR